MTSQLPRSPLISNRARAAGGLLAPLATALVVVLASLPASAVSLRPGLELLVVAGNDQQAARGSVGNNGASFTPLRVRATTTGNPAVGLPVTFSCAAPSGVRCLVLNQDIDAKTVVTGADGIATLADGAGTSSIFTRGGTGTLTVTASAPGYFRVQFRLTVVDPGRLQIPAGGSSQYVALAAAAGPGVSFAPLSLTAITASGSPAAGVPVTFRCVASGGLSCDLAGQAGPWTVSTGADGVANLADASGSSGISSRGGTGGLIVTASAPLHLSAQFALVIVDSGQLAIAAGNDQRRVLVPPSASGFGESFAPLSVKATTASGRPVAGVAVTFSCAAPAGVTCILANMGSAPMTVITNGAGIATLADPSGTIGVFSWGGTGTLTVTASAPRFGAATFQETVVAP